jgi:ABC-2 type transport system permease protein
MEAMLVGTAVAVGVSADLIVILVPAVVFLSLGSSAIGLYYSINHARYNPDKPQMRIAPALPS